MKKDTIDIQQDSIALDSSFFGVKNINTIPLTHRSKEIQHKEQIVTQFLFNPVVKEEQVYSWQSLLLIASVLLLGLSKAFSVNRFKQTYKSLFNYRVAQEICGEEKVFFHRVNILLTVNYFLITALFIYQLKETLNQNVISYSGGTLFFLILLFLIVLYFGKLIFAKIFSFLFSVPYLVSEYTFNIALFNNFLGVLLLPVLAIMYFTDLNFEIILQFIALPLLFIVFILRLLRLVVLGVNKEVSYIYIFLYICSLEILPLVVMIKFFILQ
jgi:hypothetical protein